MSLFKRGHTRQTASRVSVRSYLIVATVLQVIAYGGSAAQAQSIAPGEYYVLDLGAFSGNTSRAFGINSLGEFVGEAEVSGISTQNPTSVSDCLQMYSDPALQCKCIEKLCWAGIIPPEDCPEDPCN